VLTGGSEDDGGYQAMRQLLALKRRPDGDFCFNDPVAAGAVKAILEAGLNIPNQMAVVGVRSLRT
jgi:LacI family transcriptional regulator